MFILIIYCSRFLNLFFNFTYLMQMNIKVHGAVHEKIVYYQGFYFIYSELFFALA